MGIQYTESRDVDFGQVSRILAFSIGVRDDWDGERTKEAFLNSTYAVYALDGEKIVGTGRALSDNHGWTLIMDVAVLPEYRRRGVGGGILERIREHFSGHELFTYTYAEQIPFFEEHGFRRSRNSFTYAGTVDGAIDRRLPEKEFFLPVGYRFEREFNPPAGSFPVGRKSGADRNSIDLSFSESIQGVDFGRLNTVLSLAFGGRERNAAVTRETFENSPYVEFAFDGKKLIGCARAESDRVSQGLILFLNTHPGGVGFYIRNGFRWNKTAMLYPAHPDMPEEAAKGFVLPKGFRFADETD